MQIPMLGAEFDWAGLIASGINAGKEIYSDYSDQEIAKIQSDTLKQLQASPGLTSAKPSGMDTSTIVMIAGGGALLLLAVLAMSRK